MLSTVDNRDFHTIRELSGLNSGCSKYLNSFVYLEKVKKYRQLSLLNSTNSI